VTAKLDYTSFRIVSDRNIFNASRSRSRGGRSNQETRKPTRVDSFALVGTIDYEKGPHAFFDGSSSEFRKVLKPQGTIAGYKVTDIAQNSVKLVAGDKKIELLVGMQMRREDEGEWKLAARGESFSSRSTGASAGTADGAPSGPMGDVLARLMQQRDQETTTGSPSSSPASAETANEAPSGPTSDVLTRLMQQRDQETK
jgi:hypothetical protein